MQDKKISFIGGGNMARSLIGGLLKNGWAAQNLTISEPNQSNASTLLSLDTQLTIVNDNAVAIETADVCIFAVKPQILPQVIKPLKNVLQQQKPMLVSIAAGVTIANIDTWSGNGLPIVRCMPNTPALVESGATGLYANEQVSQEQKALAESLLRAVGITVWLDNESQIDTITALSGSGPAYHFLVMEAMQSAAEQLGLPAETAKLFSLQTAFGASKLALESNASFATLRERVTSKGGTTAAALEIFNQRQLPEIFAAAMQAAAKRSQELARSSD